MFNATVSLALATYFGLATLSGSPVVGSVDITANIVDYEIVDGFKESTAGDGAIMMCFHDVDVVGFVPCDECNAALDAGYNYISYRDVPAHVDDMITTFEFIDSTGECCGRYDFVSYCPHNN